MMGCGGRSSRKVFHALRHYTSKIVVHSQESISRRPFSSTPNLGEATILRKRVRKMQQKSPFVDWAKKFYNAGSNNQVHASRDVASGNCFALVVFSGYLVQDIYFGMWENVPYTKRRQFLLLPAYDDMKVGDAKFEKMKISFHNSQDPLFDLIELHALPAICHVVINITI